MIGKTRRRPIPTKAEPLMPDDPIHPREMLRAVIARYREDYETHPPSYWYTEALTDLGHLWLESPDADMAGFLDAITKAIGWIETEQSSLRKGLALP